MSRRLQLTFILFAIFPALPPTFVTRRAASAAQTGNSCATPSFGQGRNYQLPGNTNSIAVGDFNQDGIPDVAVTVSGNNSAVALLGNGSGGLGAATSFNAGAGAGSITTADFNCACYAIQRRGGRTTIRHRALRADGHRQSNRRALNR